MIYPGTMLSCNDNSGALTARCIGIWNLSKRRGCPAGSLIIVTIKTCLKGTSKVQRGSVQYGVITRIKQISNRSSRSGDSLWFNHNSLVLVSKKNNYLPIGTWVLGPVAKEVRKKIFIKIVLLSSGVF